MTRKDCDVLIIGSGFGGSVCALRAAEAGLRAIVLERGPRITPEFLTDVQAGRRNPLRGADSHGPFDVQRPAGLIAVMGSCVGGGSHVYTSVTVRARPDVFTEEWPAAITAKTLAQHYDRAEAIIAPSPIPIDLPRTISLESAATVMNQRVERLPLAVEWPADHSTMRATPPFEGVRAEVAAWLRGGHGVRRRSLDRTYLGAAELRGADVRPLHEVTVIEPERGGFVVHGNRLAAGPQGRFSLRAERMILAAGALNTVRLLLSCRELHRTLPAIGPALGERFYTNGDDGALLLGGRVPAERDAGPLVTAWLDGWERDRLMLMDIGLLPPLPWLAARALRSFVGSPSLGEPGRSAWIIGAMGLDRTPLRLALRNKRLICDRTATTSAFARRTRDRLQSLADALGASLVLPPAAIASPGSFTVHAMGGARMADDPVKGVTDGLGRVHSYPGLYVADASLFSSPIGVAPSLTVAALAEHVMEHLLQP
ncbi:Cholesterol oxidase precursor [Phycisphaerae bacterium RAS2]|nr:Cholesterol oxidase precursor [Phycisphaerae bacterium RAS2]